MREKLHHNERLLVEFQDEKSKTSREGSSRLANLNQALMKVQERNNVVSFYFYSPPIKFPQAKQSVAQVSEENVVLKSREQELVDRCESLERELSKASALVQQDLAKTVPPSTPSKSCSLPSMLARPLPGQTEMESLQIENEKLKQELQCMQTNFQLMSQKFTTVRKEKKEIEKSLTELQAEFDRILAEKADTETKLEETRLTLCNKLSSMSTGQERQGELEQEVVSLREELSEVIAHNNRLQEQLKTEQGRLEAGEEFARQLQEKSKSLKEWKARAEDELETLNSRLRELEEELSSHRQLKASKASQQQRQESEAIAAYKQKLERIRGERRELEGKLREANQALDEEQGKNALLEKSNKALKRQLVGVESVQQELQEQREHGSGLLREVSELSDRLAAVSEENALLREECDRLEREQKQMMDQIEELTRSTKEECERAQSQEGVVRNLQDQLGRQESELSTAADTVREKETWCVSLTEQMEELQLELANIQNAKNHFEAEVGELVQKLEELEQANFELSTKLSDAHDETVLVTATRDEQSNKLEEIEQKCQDLQALLLEKEAQLSESLYTHKLIQSENVNLVSQVSTLSEMVAARNAKIESLQTEALCYESSTRDIMSQIVALEEEHGTCAQQRQALQDEIDRASFLAREGERRGRELSEEITSLRSRLRESREQYDSLQSTNRELDQKLRLQLDKVDELVCSTRQSEGRTQQLEQEVRERESAITSVRGELEFLTKSSNDQQTSLRAEIDSLNSQCGELRAKCEDYREAEVRAESEILHLQKQLNELQTVHTELVHDRQPLQDRYDEARSELIKVQDDLYHAQKELKSVKSELRYQKRKRAEVEEQLGGMQGETEFTWAEFECLREELLKVLEEEGENTPSMSRKKIKGIIKQAKKSILKPRHNIGD